MKRIFKYAFTLSFSFIALLSCTKEETLNKDMVIFGLGGYEYEKTETDNWLYDNFIVPFNMEVKYRFDPFELELNKTLVPVSEDKVIPIMNDVKSIWIEPYRALVGDAFIKTFSPKKYVLVGSPEYNDETITLGQAEGGKKIVLFRMNWYNTDVKDDAEKQEQLELIQSMMKTVHHEFAHVLHQTVLYPEEYMNITPSGYTSQWNNVDSEEALEKGFISSYACASPDEDFVEMISRILVYGREAFDAQVEEASALYAKKSLQYDPAKALRDKESIVISYLKSVWNIDLYDPAPGVKGLETLVQEAIQNAVNKTN